MASSTEQTDAMIALVPTEADLDRLTIDEDGAESRDTLHLTLFFLGDAAMIDATTRDQLTAAVTNMVEMCDMPPILGNAFGVAHWNPTSDSPAWVLNVGDPPMDATSGMHMGLAHVRSMVLEALADDVPSFALPTQHSPWQPHICLAYAADDWSAELLRRLGPVTFDRVRIAFAGDERDVPLLPAATVAATSGGIIVPWHKVKNHASCPAGKPWAVVKDKTGDVAGCHPSETAADKQLAALYASEDNMSAETTCVECDDTVSTTSTDAPETTSTQVTAAKKPSPDDQPGNKSAPDSQKDEQCPEGHKMLGNGKCVPQNDYEAMSRWFGVLCVEGTPTGDGREFAPDALTWAEQPLLRWQKEGAHGGQNDVTVSVGRIDRVWRAGNQIMGEGVIDLGSSDGYEIWRRLNEGFAGGISIDADDISDADVEFIWREEPDGNTADDPLMLLFAAPEKMVFHAGRVRAATLVDIPAFVEARIQLGATPAEDGGIVTASAVATSLPTGVVAQHSTKTSDDTIDVTATLRSLPNILSADTARELFAVVADESHGRAPKTSCLYLHHELTDGEPGPANLTACAAAIGALRGNTQLTGEQRNAVYAHLAGHLRDAGQEPPPLEDEALTAAVFLDDWRPDVAWFTDPQLSVPTAITVTDEGRVYGHAAQWGECHIGFNDQCVTLPHEDAHPYFMTGEVACSDNTRVAVGQITVGTGHAPLSYRASQASEHYDNTGAAVADVAVGNDQFGIWIAGAIRANVAASRVHELRASGQVSGDWRRIGGQLRLVGLLAVNVPGFPVPRPRARVASGAPLSLVAAGRTSVVRDIIVPSVTTDVTPTYTESDLDQQALRRVMRMLTTRVRPTEEAADV